VEATGRLVQPVLDVGGRPANHREAQPSALPQLVVRDLGRRGRNSACEALLDALYLATLGLQGAGVGQVEIDGEDPHPASVH
jgi:hypothetical protein